MARPCWFMLLGSLLLAGCMGGYKLGPTNGEIAGARSIQVNLFRNETYEPRLSEAVGTAMRRIVQQDGTYRLNTHGDADIIVTGTIVKYERSGISFNPLDTITPRDFQIVMIAKVNAVERTSGRTLLDKEVGGRTTVRMGPDLTSAERQAVPVLAEDLARNVTSLLVDGTW